ncbi:kinase-like domain-containing protein [Gigaspora rosea]|uniref:Kinase-like domain-containing protein n=1 Tax=Gigaspora rosea TaxID=44941 RepID=A0A397V6R4_9GLOM|nr:kinase-like domain-containing protein [Gigaspora rosea]
MVVPDEFSSRRNDENGKCVHCTQFNTSPAWCQSCDPWKATQGWESGNDDIDNFIKEFQFNSTEYKKVIEWIPFNKLIDLQEIREDESEIVFMATWLDGIRIIKGEHKEYAQSRIESCGVNLKTLHYSQISSHFNEVKGNIIYGITQNTQTNQYMIVVPDEFNDSRNDANGKCVHCKQSNTSQAWCQSCDPWKAIQEWTSGNKYIDNFIKKFQFESSEYKKVIEWIPFDRLNNLQEIAGESEQVYVSTWMDGKRTIRGETGKYKQSRTKSYVNIIKMYNSKTSSIEKFKNYIQSGKYEIYGMTQNTETNQYMVVLDYYNDKRSPDNGECAHCIRFNTNPAWCQLCDPLKIIQESTSADKRINDCIKEFQLKATAYEKVIEWIPFDKLGNIITVGKGGFGTVYSANWLDGKRTVEGYVRSRKTPCKVAIKTLPASQTNTDSFLTEFKNHMTCRLEGSELEIYGLTQDAKTGQCMMVLQFANRGNLHDFLTQDFRKLTWQKKLKQLADISYDLYRIHEAKFIHGDFHSGNILINENTDGDVKSYIADLGLSRNQDEHILKGGAYGILPYVAPEILSGQQYTPEADIYGLGIIMVELSSGQRPFNGRPFNLKLSVEICQGLRPEFGQGTPDCYIELAKECIDSNPPNRPIAKHIYSKVIEWIKIIESENLIDDKKLDIKKKFNDADSIIKKTTLNSSLLHQNIFNSKFIDTSEINQFIPINLSLSIRKLKETSLCDFSDFPIV